MSKEPVQKKQDQHKTYEHVYKKNANLKRHFKTYGNLYKSYHILNGACIKLMFNKYVNTMGTCMSKIKTPTENRMKTYCTPEEKSPRSYLASTRHYEVGEVPR